MLDPTRYLNLLHLFTPLLLLLPTITIFAPNPPRLEEPEGIRPITILRIIPRRGWIISLLCILAFTTVLDAAISVALIILAGSYGRGHEVEGLGLVSWIVYPVGGLILWTAAAGASEWRGRWHDRGIKDLVVLAFICEVPNLVLLVARVTHATGTWNTITILSIPPSGLRLLVLPLLLIIASKPIIRYEPVDDAEDVEADGEPAGSSSSSARQTLSTPAHSKFPPDGAGSTPNGATPPISPKPSIVIPKKLGEVKRDERVLTWAEVWVRMKKVWPYLWPSTSFKLQFFTFLTIVLVLIGRAFTPLQPIIFGKLVRALTTVSAGIPTPSLWPLFISYFSIRTVSSTLIFFLRSLLFTPVTQYTDREMQLLCFNHLLNLSLAYHTRRNTGEVLKIIDRGSAINSLFQSILFTIAPAVIDIIVGFAVFWVLFGGVFVALTTVIMVLYVWVSIVQTQARVATRRQLSDKDVKQRGIVSDVLTNWESVKYFTAEQREVKRFREALVDYQATEWTWSLNWQTLYLWQQGLLALGLAAGSLIIAIRVRDRVMDSTELIVFIQYFGALSSPLSNLGSMYAQLNRNSIDAEKMLSLLAEATEVNDKPGAKDLVVTDGVVEFDDVVFSYDGKVDALKGVSFTIDKGTSMALVGESGSGKSTILRLLYRFYDIKSGVIRIDGQDISEVTQLSLRRAIGIVPQDSVLWNDTIGANVSYGREGATDEEIIEASKAARLHDKIMGFKEEYATIVGERGIRLSGGEKQRVSLARMFLKSPAILVLDEATSALDTETEREIQRGLTELAKGRTSLSIAHRLSTIINSDQIVVMKDGKVIENGTYKQLLDADAAFATMWKNQIFTDAERLALAQGSSSTSQAGSDLINLEEDGDDLISLEQTGEAENGLVVGNGKSEEPKKELADEDVAPSASSPQSPSTIKAGPKSPGPDGGGPEGYTTEPTDVEAPSTYADAVKITEPTAPHPPPDDVKEMSAGAADQSGPEITGPSTTDADVPSPRKPAPPLDPQRRVSLPPVSEPMSRSESTASRDSAPLLSRQSTGPLSDDKAQNRKTGEPEAKRKRLSSLKGFVRRISDQGVSRSTSARSVSGSSKGGAMGEVDEEVAAGAPKEETKENRKKQRLSMRREQ